MLHNVDAGKSAYRSGRLKVSPLVNPIRSAEQKGSNDSLRTEFASDMSTIFSGLDGMIEELEHVHTDISTSFVPKNIKVTPLSHSSLMRPKFNWRDTLRQNTQEKKTPTSSSSGTNQKLESPQTPGSIWSDTMDRSLVSSLARIDYILENIDVVSPAKNRHKPLLTTPHIKSKARKLQIKDESLRHATLMLENTATAEALPTSPLVELTAARRIWEKEEALMMQREAHEMKLYRETRIEQEKVVRQSNRAKKKQSERQQLVEYKQRLRTIKQNFKAESQKLTTALDTKTVTQSNQKEEPIDASQAKSEEMNTGKPIPSIFERNTKGVSVMYSFKEEVHCTGISSEVTEAVDSCEMLNKKDLVGDGSSSAILKENIEVGQKKIEKSKLELRATLGSQENRILEDRSSEGKMKRRHANEAARPTKRHATEKEQAENEKQEMRVFSRKKQSVDERKYQNKPFVEGTKLDNLQHKGQWERVNKGKNEVEQAEKKCAEECNIEINYADTLPLQEGEETKDECMIQEQISAVYGNSSDTCKGSTNAENEVKENCSEEVVRKEQTGGEIDIKIDQELYDEREISNLKGNEQREMHTSDRDENLSICGIESQSQKEHQMKFDILEQNKISAESIADKDSSCSLLPIALFHPATAREDIDTNDLIRTRTNAQYQEEDTCDNDEDCIDDDDNVNADDCNEEGDAEAEEVEAAKVTAVEEEDAEAETEAKTAEVAAVVEEEAEAEAEASEVEAEAAVAEAEAEADTEAEATTEAAVVVAAVATGEDEEETETDAEVDAEVDAEADAEAEAEADSEADSEAKAEAEPEAEPEADSETVTEAKAEAEPEAEPEAEAEPKAEAEPEAEAEAVVEAEAEPEAIRNMATVENLTSSLQMNKLVEVERTLDENFDSFAQNTINEDSCKTLDACNYDESPESDIDCIESEEDSLNAANDEVQAQPREDTSMGSRILSKCKNSIFFSMEHVICMFLVAFFCLNMSNCVLQLFGSLKFVDAEMYESTASPALRLNVDPLLQHLKHNNNACPNGCIVFDSGVQSASSDCASYTQKYCPRGHEHAILSKEQQTIRDAALFCSSERCTATAMNGTLLSVSQSANELLNEMHSSDETGQKTMKCSVLSGQAECVQSCTLERLRKKGIDIQTGTLLQMGSGCAYVHI